MTDAPYFTLPTELPNGATAELLTATARPIMLKVTLTRQAAPEEAITIRDNIEAEFAHKGQPCPPIFVCVPGIDITLEYPDDCE